MIYYYYYYWAGRLYIIQHHPIAREVFYFAHTWGLSSFSKVVDFSKGGFYVSLLKHLVGEIG